MLIHKVKQHLMKVLLFFVLSGVTKSNYSNKKTHDDFEVLLAISSFQFRWIKIELLRYSLVV